MTLIFMMTGAAVCLLLGIFAVSSIRELRPRAALSSGIAMVLFAALWFGSYYVFSPADNLLTIPLAIIVIFTTLFFIPLGKTRSIKIGDLSERVDERDVMFSREDYEPGTEEYDKYYALRPENKGVDDKIRELPRILDPGGKYYDPVRSPYTDAIFDVIHDQITKVDGKVEPDRVETDAGAMTVHLKQMAKHLGADEVGIAVLNPMYVYSHVGRGPEPWGEPIVNKHKFAIVFTQEMNYENVEAAPRLPITEESAAQYLKGTTISLVLAQYIRDLGYPARAHISGSNYQIMLPPVAHDAGLGELGRHGYLISPKFGARIRLGAVTTDIPLAADKPIVFGVQDFCEKCMRCAVNCPSASIPNGQTIDVRGVHKWLLNVESCLRYWRLIGTDCGLCMKVCPFSHPPSMLHNMVRAGIKRSVFARTISAWAEDIIYGKKEKF